MRSGVGCDIPDGNAAFQYGKGHFRRDRHNFFGRRERMKVLIKIRRNRTYLLRFSLKVSVGEAQQVRNFLYTYL